MSYFSPKFLAVAATASLMAFGPVTETMAQAARPAAGVSNISSGDISLIRFRGGRHFGAGHFGGRHFGGGARHFGPHRYGYRRYNGGRYYGSAVGAGLLGLAAGAIIGGALAAPAGNAVSYCESRFRSYKPATGTYTGYDGQQHRCP